jgi:hypothetical protein
VQANRIKIPLEVVHETVDGEVIVIALQTGCYYSLEGSGAELWSGLVAGKSAPELTAELEKSYSAEPGAIADSVAELVDRLVVEQLAVPVASEEPASANGHAAVEPSAALPEFPPPVLHKFTDMQDFLLADPIHDVGDAGWPHVPAAQ